MKSSFAQEVKELSVEFPYLTSLKPFMAVYDNSGFRISNGNNVVKISVIGSDYVVVKGYFSGSRPYIYDVVIAGDGAKYLPSLINSLFSKYLTTAGDDVTLYLLHFSLPKDIDVSVRLHKLFRKCFYKTSNSWVGYRVCFDVNEINKELSMYPGSYVRIYSVNLSRTEALGIIDSVIRALSNRIEYLRKDLMYELRGYRRTRLMKLIEELSMVLNGWVEFRKSLTR